MLPTLLSVKTKIRNYIIRSPTLLSAAMKIKSWTNSALDIPVAFGWRGVCYTPKFKVEGPILGLARFKLHDDKIVFRTLWDQYTVPIHRLKKGFRIRQTSGYGFLIGTLHSTDSEYTLMKRGEENRQVTNTKPYLKL